MDELHRTVGILKYIAKPATARHDSKAAGSARALYRSEKYAEIKVTVMGTSMTHIASRTTASICGVLMTIRAVATSTPYSEDMRFIHGNTIREDVPSPVISSPRKGERDNWADALNEPLFKRNGIRSKEVSLCTN